MPFYKVRAWLAIAKLRALSAKWRERRKVIAWCEERRGYGVVLIGAQASTMMETNQALPWLRYTEDQEDWGPAEPGWCAAQWVRPHQYLLPLVRDFIQVHMNAWGS